MQWFACDLCHVRQLCLQFYLRPICPHRYLCKHPWRLGMPLSFRGRSGKGCGDVDMSGTQTISKSSKKSSSHLLHRVTYKSINETSASCLVLRKWMKYMMSIRKWSSGRSERASMGEAPRTSGCLDLEEVPARKPHMDRSGKLQHVTFRAASTSSPGHAQSSRKANIETLVAQHAWLPISLN